MNVGNVQVPNLDKILRDNDESDFMPAAGSNLAAIFGLQAKTLDSCSSTKQISKKLNTHRTLTQTISNKTEVIIAKAVHAFKLQNGAYISIGKLGMALTGNLATRIYQIVLYKSKQEHVSVVTLTPDFLYIIQPKNYSSYYDSNKENWSILFENNDICIEFAREVGLARYFSKNGRIENVLYQDLSPVNKDVTVKEGDNISIKYFIVTEITQPLKDIPTTFQTMTVEISIDDNWERTLLGSVKGLKRILFVPSNKQISLGPGFPKEKDILIEVQVVDIQTPGETAHLHKIPSGKASIISRMAKMGQSILPKLPSTTTDSEDTEDDMPYKPIRQKKVESFQEELQRKQSPAEFEDEILKNSHKVLKLKSDVSTTNTACKSFVNPSVITPQWSPTQIQPNFITMDGQVYSLQSQTVTSTVPTIIDPGLNMLLSETRMTNAELRMGMSKIADNVQKVLDKFHVLELQNATSPIKDKTALDNILKMLLAMSTSEEKVSQPYKNIANIATDNFTQLNEMRERISILEKELNESKEQVRDLETQKQSLVQINENLHKTIKELEISLKDANIAFSNMKKDLEEAKELNNRYKEEAVVLENKMLKLSEECSTTEQVASSKEVNENNNKNKEIKYIMNRIYHILSDKFVDEYYSISYIRTIIATTIKNVTLQVLYNTDETNDVELELPTNNTETDASKISNTEPKISDFRQVSSILQNEPPPIPPIDTEDDNDWLH
ncbi:FK506-binding protein 15-like [Bombus pyrosoma]|uniref:FK506-binding protein 15-like n=1 Tax=Bombus pyrosoma TaxID=396416 RepID=UPI001CB96CFF|nr:FK506-binding protein 15-like [Bombus pyrosoma]